MNKATPEILVRFLCDLVSLRNRVLVHVWSGYALRSSCEFAEEVFSLTGCEGPGGNLPSFLSICFFLPANTLGVLPPTGVSRSRIFIRNPCRTISLEPETAQTPRGSFGSFARRRSSRSAVTP